METKKRKVVGIMGSGEKTWDKYSIPLAQWIAQQDYHLLTGSGGGVMAAASKAFCQVENRAGICIGIIPTEPNAKGEFIPKNNYPNPWVELCIRSPLSTFDGLDHHQISRNYICILSSDVVIALPGSKGTKNEVNLAIRFNKPIILFGSENELKDFPKTIMRTTSIERVKKFIINHS